MKKPTTFYARIFGKTDEEFQDVFVYPLYEEEDEIDCEIKIPLYIQPSCIRADVQEWMREYAPNKLLGSLKFTLSPENITLAP